MGVSTMNWLKQIRRDHGWTQRDCAELLEVSPSFLNDVEHGRRRLGDVQLGLLARETGQPLADILFQRAREEGAFTLPMPISTWGQETACFLLRRWSGLTHVQHLQLAGLLTQWRKS